MLVKRRHKITRVLLRRPLSYDHVVTPVIMDLETGFLARNGDGGDAPSVLKFGAKCGSGGRDPRLLDQSTGLGSR